MKLRKLKEHVLCAAIVYRLCGSCSSKKKPNDPNPHFLGQGGMVHTSNSNATQNPRLSATQNPRLRQLSNKCPKDLTNDEMDTIIKELVDILPKLLSNGLLFMEKMCQEEGISNVREQLNKDPNILSLLTRLVNTEPILKRLSWSILNKREGSDIQEAETGLLFEKVVLLSPEKELSKMVQGICEEYMTEAYLKKLMENEDLYRVMHVSYI